MHTEPSDTAIVVLTRVPGPGAGKSRLAAAIGAQAAAAFARAFLEDTLDACRETTLPTLLAYTPATEEASLRTMAGGLPVFAQADGDLGERIAAAIARTLATARRAVLIGSDSPDLPSSQITAAVAALETADLALGPAVDGGFTLIATALPLPPPLFSGVRWSTASVLARVAENARSLGMRVHLLPDWADVDDLASLHALAGRIAVHGRCPATRAVIARGLMSQASVTHV